MKHSNLIFIYDKMLSPQVYKSMQLPFQFISFAFTEGKMYSHWLDTGIFLLPPGRDIPWGNSVVYGAIFLVEDYFFYSGLIDSYYACSKNKMSRNHIKDMHHRVEKEVTPITFNSISELNKLKYEEKTSLYMDTYIGNINHPKIKQRLNSSHNYRIVNGIYEKGIKKLFREVANV